MKNYTLQKTCDVLASYDVVVVGGGTAGVIAAIAAANEGASVALIEQFGALGGSSTGALVTPTMNTHVEGVPMNSYIVTELDRLALARGAMSMRGVSRYYDPILLPVILEEMAVGAGVSLYLYTDLVDVVKEGKTIVGVFVSDKSGMHVIEGKQFIDCTGDGDLSVMAGAAYTKGNPKTGKNQPISLRYMVSGVDMQAFHETAPDSVSLWDGCCYAACTTQNPRTSVERIMAEARDNGDLIPEDLAYWQVFTLPSRPDTLACNCPEIFDRVDGTSAADLTNAQISGKQSAMRQLAFYKKYFKGFENAYISGFASMVGIRESREIATDRILTIAEAKRYAKFDDAVAQTNYPVDIHGFGDEYTNEHVDGIENEKPYFEIPFGSIVVRDVDNLFVAGRCIGCDFFVQAAIRIIPTVRATGEAAGIAAALCAKEGINAHEIDGVRVHNTMVARGAEFDVR